MSLVFNMAGGGGANLNFSVKPYPASTDLSQITGKENEIAVLTDTPMTDWVFNSVAPSTAQTGTVWIKTANTSNISVEMLKKNSIVQYLHGVYQYENGSWGRKDAAIYQNSAWHRFEIWLYNRGDQCTDTTGGWRSTNYYDVTTFYNDRINCRATDGSGHASVCTKNKINLSGKTKLYCRAKYGYVAGRSYGFGLTTNNDSWSLSFVAYTMFDTSNEKLYVLDITSFKDRTDLYVSMSMQSGDAYEFWLE